MFEYLSDTNHLRSFRCGLEREALRIDSKGLLSQHRHPTQLGSPLCHPYIHTDFAEAQLEWATPPFTSFNSALQFLEDLMTFSLSYMPNECFWPFSMPCPLEDTIEIARYKTSIEGNRKEVYRKGLSARYGLHLQMISGIHCNFSFPQSFWKALHQYTGSLLPLQEFINDKYLHIIRNFLRDGWLLSFLFGASPAIDTTYQLVDGCPLDTIDPYTYAGQWSTSMRMSPLGYYSRIQNQLAISFNTLDSYIQDMTYAITTPKKEYASIPDQLNANILQLENEHYSRIRPKATLQAGETPLEALKKRGITYLEVRSIDVNPYSPLGIDKACLCFIHQFLLYCLFKPSPLLSATEQQCLICDQNAISLEGRNPNLVVRNNQTVQQAATQLLQEMAPLTAPLGYQKVWEEQQLKVERTDLTPAARLLKDLDRKPMRTLGKELAAQHRDTLQKNTLSPKRLHSFLEDIQRSDTNATRLATASQLLVDGYEHLELSTQVLIKEALKRGLSVEVLDENDHLIKLSSESHTEYVKQATKTSKDTYITPCILENKHVTKKILEAQGFQVPKGNTYADLKTATDAYHLYRHKKVVVKPQSTNFGIGIAFVDTQEDTHYTQALQSAFSHDTSVIVEEFFEGKEFRFLVVDHAVIAVAHREPAHIIGDGRSSIQHLVKEKNNDPHFYRSPKTRLRLGKEERLILKEQNLDLTSIPQINRKVYLRHNSNISTGGDSIDFTATIHSGYKDIARSAAQAVGMKICGVDMLISDYQIAPNSNNHTLIELNYNPVLFIHAFPNQGEKRDVAGPILDLLFKGCVT